MTKHALVVRLDSAGDVLLTGPAIRAVAAGADRVTLLAGPRGVSAARLLPGVDRVVTWSCPWIDADPDPVAPVAVESVVDLVRALRVDEAVIFTSFHQSPLPTALVLRLAGVARISASSVDYAGSLLDVRHRPEDGGGPHEVQWCLTTARAAGFELPAGDDGRLQVRRPLPDTTAFTGPDGYVALHVGASVPARSPDPASLVEAVRVLATLGRRVVVTGGPAEVGLADRVAAAAPHAARSIAGRTGLAELADVLARAAVVVSPNTGPAHLAAAVGTPVVSLFAPVVPLERWRPWGVPTVVLGDQQAPCRGTRARECPVAGHPCLTSVDGSEIARAVVRLAPSAARRPRTLVPEGTA